MKALIGAGVSLLAGLAIGGYVGYHAYDRGVTNEAVNLMVEGREIAEAEHAARATHAIELIQSGETVKAIQLLSKPIAYYYYMYAAHADTQQRRQICAMIDRLVSTNKSVGEEITNEMSYLQTRCKAP